MGNNEELFPLVDEQGNVVGSATRRECHSGSKLLHPVVHLHVFDCEGRLFLQQRSMTKDIQPGRWDTSVGGHVDFGETVEQALLREAREELGLLDISPVKLYDYVFESEIERELVNTYSCVASNRDITIDMSELSAGKFFGIDEIERLLGSGFFTPNFELEFSFLQKYIENVNFPA